MCVCVLSLGVVGWVKGIGIGCVGIDRCWSLVLCLLGIEDGWWWVQVKKLLGMEVEETDSVLVSCCLLVVLSILFPPNESRLCFILF